MRFPSTFSGIFIDVPQAIYISDSMNLETPTIPADPITPERSPPTTKIHPILVCKDNLTFMRDMDDEKFKLIVTSPPYNLGKEYEGKTPLETYLAMQECAIRECVRILHPKGSLCWQVGNYVENGEIIPIDAVLFPIFRNLGLKLRNRIVWHFGHGLHCTKRLSGRYETINWWTKS